MKCHSTRHIVARAFHPKRQPGIKNSLWTAVATLSTNAYCLLWACAAHNYGISNTADMTREFFGWVYKEERTNKGAGHAIYHNDFERKKNREASSTSYKSLGTQQQQNEKSISVFWIFRDMPIFFESNSRTIYRPWILKHIPLLPYTSRTIFIQALVFFVKCYAFSRFQPKEETTEMNCKNYLWIEKSNDEWWMCLGMVLDKMSALDFGLIPFLCAWLGLIFAHLSRHCYLQKRKK